MKHLKRFLLITVCVLLACAMLPLTAAAADSTAFTTNFDDLKQFPTHDGWAVGDRPGGSGKAAYFTGTSGKLLSSNIDLSNYKSASLSFIFSAAKDLIDNANNLTVSISAGGKEAAVWKLTDKKDSANGDTFVASGAIKLDAAYLVAGATLRIEAVSSNSLKIGLDDLKITGTLKDAGSQTGGTISEATITIKAPTAGVKQSDIDVKSGKNFTSTLAWSGDTVDGKFQPGKTYYATITAKPNTGFNFSDKTKVTVLGSDGKTTTGSVQAPKITADSITVTVTFEIAETPTSISSLTSSNVTRSQATLTMDYTGSYTVTSYGFYWGTNASSLEHVETLENGKKSITLENLSGNTAYFYKAFVVTEEGGEVNSSTKSFRTLKGLSVTTSASAGGEVSPIGVNQVESGASFTVTVKPNDGYAINFVTIDGKDATIQNNTYTFSNITEDHTFYVAFKPAAEQKPDTDEEKKDGNAGGIFLKIVIVLLCVVLLAAVLFLLAKPADMPAGIALRNLWINLKRAIRNRR